MPRLEEYIAGALLANSLGWLTIAIIPYILEYYGETIMSIAEILISIAYLISTVAASYLVCRIAYRDKMKIGLTIGSTAILINMLFLATMRGPPLILLIELICAQVFGGILGAYIAEKKFPSTS